MLQMCYVNVTESLIIIKFVLQRAFLLDKSTFAWYILSIIRRRVLNVW